MQQPRPEPQTFAAGRAYCSLFKVFTQPTKVLSLSMHSTLWPRYPPPAPLRSPSCRGLSSRLMSCCSSWMVTSGGRMRSQSSQGSSPVVAELRLWVITPPRHTLQPSSLHVIQVQSILSTVFLPTVRSFCQNNIFLRVNITFVGAGKGYSLGFWPLRWGHSLIFFFFSYSLCGTCDLQDTQQTYLWIQAYSHSHPDLQLSGLMPSLTVCHLDYSFSHTVMAPSRPVSLVLNQNTHGACTTHVIRSWRGCADKFKEHHCCFTDAVALNYYLSSTINVLQLQDCFRDLHWQMCESYMSDNITCVWGELMNMSFLCFISVSLCLQTHTWLIRADTSAQRRRKKVTSCQVQ